MALALSALVLASYWPALSAGFVWDDSIFAEAPVIREGASGLARIWFDPGTIEGEHHYWPIVYSSFWLEHALWGLAPLGSHLVNLLLHLLVTFLVWRLLHRLAVPGAAAAAAIFAVHPLHVESVAWAIERKDLLSAAFFLGALLAWLGFVAAPGLKRYLGSLLLFVAALLSKSIAVTLPVTLLLERFWTTGRIGRADLLRTAPFFAVGLVVGLADLAYYRTREGLDLAATFVERLLAAARALGFYVGKLVWPVELPVIYPRWEIRAADPAGWAWVAAALALAAAVWFGRRRLGRGPLAGLGFFAVTLSPVLGFVDYGYLQFAFVADRFQYLAGIGIMALAAGAAAAGAARLARPLRGAVLAGFTAVLLLFAGLSHRQSEIWRDEATLFGHIVSRNPEARDAWFNLAHALSEEGRTGEALGAARASLGTSSNPVAAHLFLAELHRELDEREAAVALYREALALGPDPAVELTVRAILADSLRRLGSLEEAAEAYERLAALDPEDPAPLSHLANIRSSQGRADEAEEHIRRARALAPRDPVILQNVAEALRKQERHEEAVAGFGRVLELDPEMAAAYAGRGAARFVLGRHEAAASDLERAIELEPEAASRPGNEVLIGRALLALGRSEEEAAARFRAALEADPRHPAALDRLGLVRFRQGRYREALDLYERHAAEDPDNAAIHSNIGAALYQLQRRDEAIASLERALELDPAHEPARRNLEQIRRENPRPPGWR